MTRPVDLDDEQAIAFSVADTGIGIARRGPGADLPGVHADRQPAPAPRAGHRPRPAALPQARGAARRRGRRRERARRRLDASPRSIPAHLRAAARARAAGWDVEPRRLPVLVVEDSTETLLLYDKMLGTAGFQVLGARTLREARDALAALPAARDRPRHRCSRGEDAWTLLDRAEAPARHCATSRWPSSRRSRTRARRIALGADAYLLKPVDRQRLLADADPAGRRPRASKRVLVVDDEEISRYVLRQHLLAARHVISEAASGEEALRLARAERPDVICLDLGDAGPRRRRGAAPPAGAIRRTRDIPVVIVTVAAARRRRCARCLRALGGRAHQGRGLARARAGRRRCGDARRRQEACSR